MHFAKFLLRITLLLVFLPVLFDRVMETSLFGGYLILQHFFQFLIRESLRLLLFFISLFIDKSYNYFGGIYSFGLKVFFTLLSMSIPPTKFELRKLKTKLSKSAKRAKKRMFIALAAYPRTQMVLSCFMFSNEYAGFLCKCGVNLERGFFQQLEKLSYNSLYLIRSFWKLTLARSSWCKLSKRDFRFKFRWKLKKPRIGKPSFRWFPAIFIFLFSRGASTRVSPKYRHNTLLSMLALQ